MALIGDEKFIKCRKCGCVEFIEQRVIQIDDDQVRGQLNVMLRDNLQLPAKELKYEYVCTKCGEKL